MYEKLPPFVSNPDPEIYLSDGYLVLDFECTNKEYGTPLDARNSLLLACWSLGPNHPLRHTGQHHAVWADEFRQHLLLEHIEQSSFVVAHHFKFEAGWLRRCGANLRRLLSYDTMIGEKVIAGNRKVLLSLEATATRRGLGHKESTVSSLIQAGVCPSSIPSTLLETYCQQDVALTESVFIQQRKELHELALLPVAYCRNLVTPVLADIEFSGMVLDPERVSETYEDYATRYNALSEEFSRFTGGINFRSPKQLAEYLYDTLAFKEICDRRGNPERTPAGGRKTGKDVIPRLEATTEQQKEFKKLATAVMALKVPMQNLEKMQKVCKENPLDPRMYFSFNQTVTDTDRLSSNARLGGMQGQNIDSAFKRLFRAGSESRRMCETDSKQLEFRMAIHLGRCRQGLADVLGSVDIHQASADYHGITRKAAKARTFRPLFGGKSGTARERKYIDYFTKRYDGISRMQARWAMDAAANKFIVTETGSRFYFPEASITESGYVTGQTKIYNYPIQQISTGDLIPLCLVLVWHLIGDLGDACFINNSIHDSIIADCETIVLDRYKAITKWAFTDGGAEMMYRLFGIELTVPLGAGLTVAQHWADTKEEWEYDPKVTGAIDWTLKV